MSKCNKIISSIVLICFIFNTAVSDFAFGQSSNTSMTDKLAAQSKFSNIQPIENKDIGDIELWFAAALNYINTLGLEINRENLQKFADMPGKLPGKTIFQLERAQFFIHEIPPAEDGVLKIKATRKDLTHGARTYTIEYSSANEQLDVYPEGGSKQRAAEDRSAIDRYEETNEKIIDKFTAERIAEGNFAEIEGRAKALGWDNLYPVRMKPKSYWPKQLMDTVSKDISRVLSIFGLSLDEAFEGKNIVFIKVPPGMSLPVIKIDEREVLVDCHTSNNAVYLFLKEEEFAFIEKSLEGGAEISVTDLEGVRSGYLSYKIFHEVGVAYGLYRMRLDTGGILSDLDLAGLLYTSLGLKKEELIQRFPQLRNLVTVDLDTNLAIRDYAAGTLSEVPLTDGEGGLIDKLKSALSRKGMSAKEVDEVISLYRREVRPRFSAQDKFSTPELVRAVLRVVISRINSNEDPIRLFNILKKADFSKVDAGIELGDFLRDTFTASPLTQTLQVSQRPSSQAATEANTAQYSPERPASKGAAHSSILEDAEINIRRAADIMKLDPELLELILKPKRITFVKFEILLDSGERKTFYAFRVLQNDALGAGKGGIRWLVVTGETLEEAMKTAAGLATLMTIKNAVINIPYGGAKGDIVIPIGDYTLNDQARIIRAFSHELTKERAIGPFIDVPAPDQGTDARMMAWFLDQNLADLTERGEIFDKTIEAELKRVKASDDPQKTPHLDRYVEVLDDDKDGVLQGFELGTITGKPIGKGGSESRTKATGFGGFLALKNVLSYFDLVNDFDKDTVGRTLNKKVREVLKKGLKHMTAAVQGTGNVGEYHAWELYRAGVPITILEDAVLEGKEHINYTLYHPDGIDIELLNKNLERLPNGRWASLKTLKDEFLRDSGYKLIRNDKRFFWKTYTNIKVPAAAESVITSENAEDVNCEIVNELANDPTTPDADRRLRERGILIIPDSFANTGGVGFSYYEWLQNIEGRYHKGATLDKMFEERMSIEADVLFAFAEKYRTDLRMAAYIMYLARVGNAEIARSDELSNKFTDKNPYMYYGELGLAPATVEELNRMITQGKFDQFINKTDELKSREIDAIAGQVLDKLSGEETGFVLASGATTSGKLGFVVSLTDRLRSAGRRVIRLNFDALKLADLEALRDGKAITAIDYIAGKKMTRTIMPKRGDIFVVEGNYAIEDEVLNAIPEKNRITMWINKIPSVKLEDNWPLTSLDDRLLGNILTVYHTEGREAIDVIRGWPAERKVQMERVFPTWVNADITFNAYLPYELPIIKFYVEDMVTKAMEIAKRDNDKTSIKIIERLQRTLKGVIAVKIPDNISVNPIIQQYIGDGRFYGALVDLNNTQAAMESKKPSNTSFSGQVPKSVIVIWADDGMFRELVEAGRTGQDAEVRQVLAAEKYSALRHRYEAVLESWKSTLTVQDAIDWLSRAKIPGTDDIYDSFRDVFSRNPEELAEFEKLFAERLPVWDGERAAANAQAAAAEAQLASEGEVANTAKRRMEKMEFDIRNLGGLLSVLSYLEKETLLNKELSKENKQAFGQAVRELRREIYTTLTEFQAEPLPSPEKYGIRAGEIFVEIANDEKIFYFAKSLLNPEIFEAVLLTRFESRETKIIHRNMQLHNAERLVGNVRQHKILKTLYEKGEALARTQRALLDNQGAPSALRTIKAKEGEVTRLENKFGIVLGDIRNYIGGNRIGWLRIIRTTGYWDDSLLLDKELVATGDILEADGIKVKVIKINSGDRQKGTEGNILVEVSYTLANLPAETQLVVAVPAKPLDVLHAEIHDEFRKERELSTDRQFQIVTSNLSKHGRADLVKVLDQVKAKIAEANPGVYVRSDTIIQAVNATRITIDDAGNARALEPMERLIVRSAFLGTGQGMAGNYLEKLGHDITEWLKAGDYARVREQLLDSGRTYLDKASYRDYELKPPKNRDLDRELEVLRNVLCYTEDGSKFLKSQYYTSIVGVARVRFAMAFGLPMQGVEIKGSTAKVEILSKIYKNPTRQDNDYRNTRRSIGDRINPEEFTVVRISGFNEYLIIDKENKFASYISASVERGALVASFHIYNPLPISANSVEKPEFGQTPSSMPADVSEESMAENIEFKLGQKLSLFEDAGKQIPTAPDTRYTLLVDNNIYKGDECEKDIEGYALVDGRHIGAADRFNLEKVNTSDVNNILEHVRDSARTVIQLSRELSAEELKLLNEKAPGIRVVRIDTTYFKNDRELSADQRRDCRFDLYAMMLLARQVTQEDKDRYSSVYRSLAFMLNTHYKEGGEVVSDDYIDAILKGDMLFIVKHNLSYRPAGRWKVPDYNTIAAALISA